MNRFVKTVLGGIGAGLLAAATLGGGVAQADPLAGKTYDQASTWIADRNGKAVVASVVGGQLDLSKCIVMSSSRGKFIDALGENNRRREYYLHLNCQQSVADGKPGNSVTSPLGARAKKERETAEAIKRNIERKPDYCIERDWCVRFCERTGLCEPEG